MEHSVIKYVSAILRLRGNPFCLLLLVILFVFSACSDKIESGTDNGNLLQRKSITARAMAPTDFSWQEYADGYDQEVIWEYYMSPEMVEERYAQPYTYMTNKYLDLFIDFFAQYGYLADADHVTDPNMLQQYPYDLELQYKLQYVQNFIQEYDDQFADVDLGSTPEDEFCDKMATTLHAELNTMSEVLALMDEAIDIANENGEELDVPALLEGSSINIGTTCYHKFLVLAYAETDQVYSHRTSNCEDYGVPEMSYVTKENQEDDSMLKGPQRLVRLNRVALWGRKIFYVNYDNRCPDIEEAKAQMHEWERATDNYIRFVERKDNGWTRHCWWTGWRYIVRLTSTSDPNVGGSSTVGCVPWSEIEFNPNAWSRTYLHELGHTLGLLHEMQRYDRDLYIVVDCENIKEGYAHNFKKKSSIGATTYGRFDYESIMMYSPYAFAKNTDRPTMTKIDGSEIGVSTVLSEGDIQNIKSLYHN